MAEKNWWHSPLGIVIAGVLAAGIISAVGWYFSFSIERELKHIDGRFDGLDKNVNDIGIDVSFLKTTFNDFKTETTTKIAVIEQKLADGNPKGKTDL